MEEDIKKIEYFLNQADEYFDNNIKDCAVTTEVAEAIENLINRNKELEEDNYAYHQLMQMQNKREYRSKFLKDFKSEYGENVMPDYDEIYKRYDKMKKQLNNSISKSKVQELIDICNNTNEEYVELPNGKVINRSYCDYLIEYLQELLQEGDDK